MEKWPHLFVDGEYAVPEKILSGLTFEQVTQSSSEESHSIYQELWHLTRWQNIIAFRDEKLYETWAKGERYPTHPPTSEEDWHNLVGEFFTGLNQVFEWTSSPEKLKVESDPGVTMADNLTSLAIHNAYHLGKIVAIRQALGSWSTE